MRGLFAAGLSIRRLGDGGEVNSDARGLAEFWFGGAWWSVPERKPIELFSLAAGPDLNFSTSSFSTT